MEDYIFKPGNIWSGSRTLAVLTNPTELAFRKGNLKKHYPVKFEKREYLDVEFAYKENRIGTGNWDKILMIQLINIKLKAYPEIVDAIEASGGLNFLRQCTYEVYGKSKWEGKGPKSSFITALMCAYALRRKWETV